MKFLLLLLLPIPALLAAPVAIFDGKSLDGWQFRPGEEKWWRVQDGAITGGSLEEKVPANTFLVFGKSYGNFELTLKIRLVRGSGFQNSGVQIRSQRKADSHEMIGYQIDAGAGYWGDIYDESRRDKAIAKPIDPAALAKVVRDWDWNDYRILCEGPRIRTWINGQLAHDFTETDASIPRDGLLALQAHGGGKFLVQMKDVTIREIATDGARDPEAQRAGFKLPDGFSAELVASEQQGVGKPVTVTWDRHGRMWTMTALEYPVDANENEAAAKALFTRGGKDRVLVFDEPNAPGPQTPRVFADQLAIPLGLLPLPNGVLVQHGGEIRRYADDNDDGKADRHEVLLEGFGIQDSHLFPHQFERAPGGWIYLAQGAFNASNVRRPGGLAFADGGKSVVFNNCKLARFRADGSAFESLTGGPNNIWGLVISPVGETFVQEANDMGYPVAEFAPGTHYPTGFGPKMRPDAPVLPRSTEKPVMGGTGLSGLALAADDASPFATGFEGAQVFYVANPITSKIQIVTLTRDENGHPAYQKQPDFMLSDDPWFRPIAVRFGPDGCLYVVDWYNKIISHNEVPRAHPDRDKSRGRIWRIRHDSQQAPPRLDMAALSDRDLLAGLAGPNALVSTQVWQEIVDRKASGLAVDLGLTSKDPAQSVNRRIAALWALEGLGQVPAGLLAELAAAPFAQLRHEAVRIAGGLSLAEPDFLAVMKPLANETDFRVRAALANALRDHREPSRAMMESVANILGLEPVEGSARQTYDRAFERCLFRWALSAHPAAAGAMAGSADLTLDARLLAARSLPDAEAAVAVLALLPEIDRPLGSDEIALLGSQLGQSSVQQAFARLLADPSKRRPMLDAMTRLDPEVAAVSALGETVARAVVTLLADDRAPANERLAVTLARRFRLAALAPEIVRWLAEPGRSPAELAEGLAALRESGGAAIPDFQRFLDHPHATVRQEALTGFASLGDPAVVAAIAGRWDALPGAHRLLAVDGMTATAAKAESFARALSNGRFASTDAAAVEKIVAALGTGHPAVSGLMSRFEGLLRPVIRLDGNPAGRIGANIFLSGPFTVESWIQLDPKLDNADALLGRSGGPDINFYQGKLRLYSKGDQIIATRPIAAGEWTHCAITRDENGELALYLDGEPDARGGKFSGKLSGLHPGESSAAGGSAANYDELRIWNIARGPDEIRRDFRTRYSGSNLPAGLLHRFDGHHPGGPLEGGAKVTLTRDFPDLVSPAEAAALEEKFAAFRAKASRPGDPAAGKQLAQATCLICHQVSGEGLAIGPDLSGAGAMGTEALLRNILTPNAQLESGYYRHDVNLTDGSFVSGFLKEEKPRALVIRQIGADDRVIPRDRIRSHVVSRRSLMPEGLIDGFTDQQVADLLSYLESLK